MVLVSPADHAQHAKVRAEEQRVSEHADGNTWVSTWTSEQLVETAKTLTKPRPHTSQVVRVRRSRSETDAVASSDARELTQLERQSREGQTRTTNSPQRVEKSNHCGKERTKSW